MFAESKAGIEIYGAETLWKPLKDFATLGKDENCTIQISDDQIEDRHARVEIKLESKKDQSPEPTYYLKDLRSSLGTFVNGTRIQEAILTDGDLIQIGETELRFLLNRNEDSKDFPLKSKNHFWNQELLSFPHFARTNFPILLLGPSGTGKDVLATALHECSARAEGPLVIVNCSALTETLIESELFGHVKGSFTGAINDRKGAFEAARGGTLFLDEIGDLSLNLQAKLLRAIENNEVRPVGSDKNILTDVRVIAATHQHLEERIKNGLFRMDLFYRLNVLQINPPALENRMEDFDGLLNTFSRQLRVKFSFGAIQRMKKHKWPGNIRELKNFISRASALYPKQQIMEEQIDRLFDKGFARMDSPSNSHRETLPVIKEIEKQMIVQRLTANKGNQRLTAHDLGMPKSTLHDRLKYYKLDPRDFRDESAPEHEG